jgi:hypothetical protein
MVKVREFIHENPLTDNEVQMLKESREDAAEIKALCAENERLRMALAIADGSSPLSKWKQHQGIRSMADFQWWVDTKLREYLLMAAQCNDPELTDWIAARKGTFEEVKLNLTTAMAGNQPPRDTSE